MSNENSDQHAKLVEDRNKQYDAAHLKTSRWIQEHLEFIASLGDMSFSVIMIVNKLHRMEGDVLHVDNIDDIIGYGKCARQALDLMTGEKAKELSGPWIPSPQQVIDAAIVAASARGGVNANGNTK